ncbi:unnamed protein product [Adineta ricciae]|uniref:GH16 domain-containing protein n=1 Tax=Adineta ricciae TaxID=249248 RepID=A0A815G0W8_ADIRI|nr:unnamed protein product [Adineta ricciae]
MDGGCSASSILQTPTGLQPAYRTTMDVYSSSYAPVRNSLSCSTCFSRLTSTTEFYRSAPFTSQSMSAGSGTFNSSNSIQEQNRSPLQNSNKIEVFIHPSAQQRLYYESEYESGPLRFIQGPEVPTEQNGKEYKYPAIRVLLEYCDLIPSYYIRVTLTTIQQGDGRRYIHPNRFITPDEEEDLEVLRNDKSLFYPIKKERVDANRIMEFKRLVMITNKLNKLKEYTSLVSFETNEECPITVQRPRDTINEYQLHKSQLAFSLGQFIDANHFYSIQTIFSDVMEETKDGRSKDSRYTVKSTVASKLYDNFTQDGAIDSKKWKFVEDNGIDVWDIHTKQYYTTNVLTNARCQNNHLVIEARNNTNKGPEFTSARLRCKRAFLYGRLEIRAKLPDAKGTWSSFVLVPAERTYGSAMWPDNGQINFVSHVGREPTIIRSSVFIQSNNPRLGDIPFYTADVPDATKSFKTYTLIWSPDEIEMFVRMKDTDKDDRRIFLWEKNDRDWTFWPFDKPFHLEIALDVGGDVAGNQIDNHLFPQRLEIEYIHYEKTH